MKERRRFIRYHIDRGLIVLDDDDIIGMARVIDISDGGFGCVGLSPIPYSTNWINGIDLYDPNTDISLQQISGRMTRYVINKNSTGSIASTISYFVGFEVSPNSVTQIANFREILCGDQPASS